MASVEMQENIIKYYANVTDRAMVSLKAEKKFQFRRNLTNKSLEQVTKDTFQSIHNSEKANELINEYMQAMQKMHLLAQKEYNMMLNLLKSTNDTMLKQKILNNYANEGVHGFTAVNGARWNIETYSNMYTTHVNNQLIRMNILESSDKNSLFQVSDHSTVCELCIPYENKLLSREQLDNSTLFHPNCKHFITEVRKNV